MEEMKELLKILFPTDGLTDNLSKIPALLFDFKNYTLMIWIALGIAVVFLVGCLIYGSILRKSYKTLGNLSIIAGLLGFPLILLSLGSFLGNSVWIATVVAILFYIICQCIVDSEQVGWNSLFGIGVVVFGAFAICVMTDVENDAAVAHAFGITIPFGAMISAIAGIIKKDLDFSKPRSSNTTYAPVSASSSPPEYMNIFDARERLRVLVNSSGLTTSEKEALVKQHNDKYLDHISIKNGMYYNFSDD